MNEAKFFFAIIALIIISIPAYFHAYASDEYPPVEFIKDVAGDGKIFETTLGGTPIRGCKIKTKVTGIKIGKRISNPGSACYGYLPIKVTMTVGCAEIQQIRNLYQVCINEKICEKSIIYYFNKTHDAMGEPVWTHELCF